MHLFDQSRVVKSKAKLVYFGGLFMISKNKTFCDQTNKGKIVKKGFAVCKGLLLK
jgi:hypothetical protein